MISCHIHFQKTNQKKRPKTSKYRNSWSRSFRSEGDFFSREQHRQTGGHWITTCEQHTSHFSHFFTSVYTHMRGSNHKFGVRITFHESSSCAHVVCLILFDFSTFRSLLFIFSPIVLSFLLAINFICHDVVGKFLVHSR